MERERGETSRGGNRKKGMRTKETEREGGEKKKGRRRERGRRGKKQKGRGELKICF